MIKTLLDEFNSIDKKIKKIMKYGIIFSFIVCIISMIFLIAYKLNANLDFFYIGLSIFRLSLFLTVEFIICALAINTIKKQIC